MSARNVVYLSGGVGGARLAHGLARILPPERLRMIVNTGDDFTHWGLSISPDLDTVMYTLSDLADVARGWGIAGDSFEALASVKRYGGEAWFQLGDRDLATHVLRTQWLREGHSLSEVTARLCRGLAVRTPVLPMCDQPFATMIDTDAGTLSFQAWLVGARGAPLVRRVWFDTSDTSPRASDAVLDALAHAQYAIIGPSNPYVSIDPILALPGVRDALARVPVIAVSPIVHGQAVKGPLAGMLRTLANAEPGPASIARHYGSLLHALVVERGDEAFPCDVPVLATATLMHSREHSFQLGMAVVEFARRLGFDT